MPLKSGEIISVIDIGTNTCLLLVASLQNISKEKFALVADIFKNIFTFRGNIIRRRYLHSEQAHSEMRKTAMSSLNTSVKKQE